MGSESALVEQQAPPQTDGQKNPDLFQFAYPMESQSGAPTGEGAMPAFQSFAPESQAQSQPLPEGFPQDVQIAGMEGAPAGDPALQSGPVIESAQDQTETAAAAPELDPQTEAHLQELEGALTQLMSIMNAPESPQTSQQIESDLTNVLNASFDIGQSATVAATQANPSAAGNATGSAPPSEAAVPAEAMTPPSEAAMPAEAMAPPYETAMAPQVANPGGEQVVSPESAAPHNSLNFAPQEQSNGQVDALDTNLAATPRTAELQTQLKDAIKDLVTNYPNQNSSEAEKKQFTEKILAAAQIAQKIGIIAKAKELGQPIPADF